MKYVEINPPEVPTSLLLEADPSTKSIKTYLSGSWCFAAKKNNEIVGACVVKPIAESAAEIFNISVKPNLQGQGIGSKLLDFVLNQLKSKQMQRVEIGTGTFGYQLTYYQRFGFRVDTILKDHFINNYDDPIFENGIQHKDMLRLYLQL